MAVKNEPTNPIARFDRQLTTWLQRHPAIGKVVFWFGPIENRKKVLRFTGWVALIDVILIGITILIVSQ